MFHATQRWSRQRSGMALVYDKIKKHLRISSSRLPCLSRQQGGQRVLRLEHNHPGHGQTIAWMTTRRRASDTQEVLHSTRFASKVEGPCTLCFDSIGPLSSTGSPMTFMMRPRVSCPTGTMMGLPVSVHPWHNSRTKPQKLVRAGGRAGRRAGRKGYNAKTFETKLGQRESLERRVPMTPAKQSDTVLKYDRVNGLRGCARGRDLFDRPDRL